MSLYVVDASVVVKWFVPEVHTDAALRLRHTSRALHAPDFLTIAFGNVLCKKVRQDEITRDEADAAMDTFRALPVQLHPWQSHFDRAYALAQETRRSLYDCLYLALAVLMEGEMVTADRKFLGALHEGPYAKHLRWVEDLPPSSG